MLRNPELNHYRIANPDGLSHKYDEYNRRTFRDRKHNDIQEDSSRAFREIRRTPEYYKRHRKSKPKKQRAKTQKQQQKKRLARSLGASAAGQVLVVFAAVVFCSFVYVSSLSIRVRPCASMMESLAFQTFFRNPDERPLRAVLYSERERYDKDFVGVAYLLFEGLQKKSEYELSIVSLDTEEEIYHSTFLTAADDPYQIRVDDPHITPEGVFEFGLRVGGLELKDFYTVFVMDKNGKTVAVLDGAEERASFSIPIKSLRPSDETEQPSDATGEPSDAAVQPGTTGRPSDAAVQPDTTGQPPDALPELDTSEEPPDASPEPDTTEEPPDVAEEPDTAGEPDAAEEVDIDALPFITVRINGKTFLPKVWNNDPEPIPESVAEEISGPETVPEEAPDEIEWIWNEERTEAEALIPNPENPEEKETVSAEITETVAKEPQCEEPGLAVYTATVPTEDGGSYQDVRTALIPATGHRYERVSVSATGNQTSAEYVCPDCGKTYRIDATVTEETN